MNDLYKLHGAFSWCELVTTDAAGAKNFYKDLFGWSVEDLPMEGMTYSIVKAGDREVGGIMATPPEASGMPPAWGTYVTVDDVDATADKAKQLGGKVLVEPQDIPDVGRFCVIQDPQGASIAAITYIDKVKNA